MFASAMPSPNGVVIVAKCHVAAITATIEAIVIIITFRSLSAPGLASIVFIVTN